MPSSDLLRLLDDAGHDPALAAAQRPALDDGHLVNELTRSPRFFDPQRIDDPLLQSQRLLQERLSPHFPLIRAISFASSGSTEP